MNFFNMFSSNNDDLILVSDCYRDLCCKYNCNHHACIHAVMQSGKLKIMHGQDVYKLLSKYHPMYDHFYKMYDVKYLVQEKMRRASHPY